MSEHAAQGSKTGLIVAVTAVVTTLVVAAVMYLALGSKDGATDDEVTAANAKIAEQAKEVDSLKAQVDDLTAANEKLKRQFEHQKKAHEKAQSQVEELESSSSGDLTDGRYPVFVKAADGTSGSESVTVDVIQFYTGNAANKASEEDGGEVPVPNDIYTRNESKKLRTLPVASGTVGTVPYWQGQTMVNPPDGKKVTFSQFATAMGGSKSWQENDQNAIYWITLTGGEVTKIAFQFTP